MARRSRRRADPEPVRALQRRRAPGRDDRPRAAPGCGPARNRPLRAGREPTACCVPEPTRRRIRPTCSAALDRDSIALMRFPLGGLTKPQVRELAEREGLPVASKPDSQDLCFLAGTGREAFLARHGDLGARPGPVLDAAGRTIGSHRGAHGYTIGQRRGIGVAGTAGAALRDRDRRRAEHGHRRAPGCASATGVRLRDVRLHVPAAAVDAGEAALSLHPGRLRSRGRHARTSSSPSGGPRPDRPPFCCAATSIVGCATIAR